MRHLLLAFLVFAAPASAQTCDLTGTGGAYYSVWHADTLVSVHTREYAAAVSAMAAEEANPAETTEVRFPTTPIRVECEPRVDTIVVGDPGPAPDPAPDPDPTPEGAPAVGDLFSARWTDGVTDGGRFSNLSNGQYFGDSSRTLDVLPAVLAGLPDEFGGVLRMRMRRSGYGQMTAVGAVPESTTHWGRIYYRSDAGRRSQHGSGYIASGGGGSFNHWQILSLEHYGGSGATSPLRWGIRTAGPYPTGRYLSPTLQKGTWYRFEWMIEYVTATTVRVWPRIYDMAGELVADAADFRDEEGRSTLEDFWSSNTLRLGAPDDAANAREARDFTLGLEDPSNAGGYDPASPAYIYVAALDFSSTGWIGR